MGKLNTKTRWSAKAKGLTTQCDRNKIKKAVLEAHKHGVIGGYGGEMSHYIEVKDSDYNVLRDVVKLLKKNKS